MAIERFLQQASGLVPPLRSLFGAANLASATAVARVSTRHDRRTLCVHEPQMRVQGGAPARLEGGPEGTPNRAKRFLAQE